MTTTRQQKSQEEEGEDGNDIGVEAENGNIEEDEEEQVVEVFVLYYIMHDLVTMP